jgi:hypothetical protein
VAKVETSNPDRTINLKRLQCVVENKHKVKTIPLQAWTGPEGSRMLRLSNFKTTHEGGKVVSPMHRPALHPGNIPGTHFCYKLSRPQSHSAAGGIMSIKKSCDAIGNRNRDLPAFIAVPQPTVPLRAPSAYIAL